LNEDKILIQVSYILWIER